MSRKSAFTLLEVLTCLGILGILATIVLAALASGKDRASQATCLSNMQQIHAAVTLYRQDFDGADSGTSVAHMGLPPFMGGLALWGYVKSPEIMWCQNRNLTEFGRRLKTDGSPWNYEDYSIYRMYYNFPAKYSEDTKWPLFVCRYEDIQNVRRNPARIPDIVSAATLDGTIYRFPYKKILESAHQTEGGAQDEIYR